MNITSEYIYDQLSPAVQRLNRFFELYRDGSFGFSATLNGVVGVLFATPHWDEAKTITIQFNVDGECVSDIPAMPATFWILDAAIDAREFLSRLTLHLAPHHITLQS